MGSNRRSTARSFLAFAAMLMALALCACSGSGYVSRSTADYNVAVEDATNNMLVVNVLRARDEAPLSFSDLSQIRGSLSVSAASQAAWPFGPFGHDSSRTNTVSAGPVSLAINPSFDIAPLNTKQFSEGVLQSVSPDLLYYYLQRGTCPSVVLPLLIGSIANVTINDGKMSEPQPLGPSDRAALFRSWAGQDLCGNAAGTAPQIRYDDESVKFGPALPASVLGQPGIISQLVQADAAKLSIRQADGQVQLYKSESHPVLCVSIGNGRFAPLLLVTSSPMQAPLAPYVPKSPVCGAPTTQAWVAGLRSTQAIFYFLGDIVRAEDKLAAGEKLTAFEQGAWAENRMLNFHITQHPSHPPRFSVGYRGKTYDVAQVVPAQDDTITTLSILADLLNLHRDAAEIPSTQAVQAVP
jgi:hypothetical protein